MNEGSSHVGRLYPEERLDESMAIRASEKIRDKIIRSAVACLLSGRGQRSIFEEKTYGHL
jgi:hypothetical protein